MRHSSYAELSASFAPFDARPLRQRLDAVLAAPPPAASTGHAGADNRWAWCDALFMGPVSWLMVYEVTATHATSTT
jgi:rhamnogalacturonyl hydrolase YesR